MNDRFGSEHKPQRGPARGASLQTLAVGGNPTQLAVVAAAEALNKANVRDAQNTSNLYREAMSPEARKLDEAFQAYYEAQQPSTECQCCEPGERCRGLCRQATPIPPTSERIEFNAKEIGFTLKDDTPPEPAKLPSGKTFYFD